MLYAANMLLSRQLMLKVVRPVIVTANHKSADRGGLQTPEDMKCCLQSRRPGRPEDSLGQPGPQHQEGFTYHLSDSRDSRNLWQGIPAMTNDKSPPTTVPPLCWMSWMSFLLGLRCTTSCLLRSSHPLLATRCWGCLQTAWGEHSEGLMPAKLLFFTIYQVVHWGTDHRTLLMHSQTSSTSHWVGLLSQHASKVLCGSAESSAAKENCLFINKETD